MYNKYFVSIYVHITFFLHILIIIKTVKNIIYVPMRHNKKLSYNYYYFTLE